ncbi:MAG TPA: diaminopimelate epimerase [Blastocatellia bacterium]|nr:diaminopimelate epimerase [Blastocatellia bacterium]
MKLKEIRFSKVQGLGNDFLIIRTGDVSALGDAPEMAIRMCDRNFGAGADGIVFIARARHEDHEHADFDSRIFNADGSEAEISGNGTRCAAAYLYYTGTWGEPEVKIRTAAGVKRGRLVSRAGPRFEFAFDMGRPRLSSDAIGMALDPPLDEVVRYPLRLGGDVFEVTCVSMGNPHCALFVPNLGEVNLAEIGPLIEDHPIFPNRTNVEFVRVISRDEIEVRFWERGVGRTLSSGTGSSSAAIAAALNGLTGRNVRVLTAGGELEVDWREDDTVILTGPAEMIYEGRWLRD